jgi:hypothetical protein
LIARQEPNSSQNVRILLFYSFLTVLLNLTHGCQRQLLSDNLLKRVVAVLSDRETFSVDVERQTARDMVVHYVKTTREVDLDKAQSLLDLLADAASPLPLAHLMLTEIKKNGDIILQQCDAHARDAFARQNAQFLLECTPKDPKWIEKKFKKTFKALVKAGTERVRVITQLARDCEITQATAEFYFGVFEAAEAVEKDTSLLQPSFVFSLILSATILQSALWLPVDVIWRVNRLTAALPPVLF